MGQEEEGGRREKGRQVGIGGGRRAGKEEEEVEPETIMISFNFPFRRLASSSRQKIKLGGNTAVMVMACQARYVVLLCHNPFRDVAKGVWSAGGFAYEVTTAPQNVNPRLEFFTYTEKPGREDRRKEEEEKRQWEEPRQVGGAKGGGEYDPRAEAQRMDAGGARPCSSSADRQSRKKRTAYESKAHYWRRELEHQKGSWQSQQKGAQADALVSASSRGAVPWESKGGGSACRVRFSRPTRFAR